MKTFNKCFQEEKFQCGTLKITFFISIPFSYFFRSKTISTCFLQLKTFFFQKSGKKNGEGNQLGTLKYLQRGNAFLVTVIFS